jgi:preprotein translocase subunit SecE
VNGFFQELFQASIYKKSQGRITRQVTFGALALAAAVGCWRLHQTLLSPPKFLSNWFGGVGAWWDAVHWGLPFALLLVCWWIAYRLVNLPRFADFLIAVEAEMNKVSWPTWNELVRGSVVVLATILALAVVLAVFDLAWSSLFRFLGIL